MDPGALDLTVVDQGADDLADIDVGLDEAGLLQGHASAEDRLLAAGVKLGSLKSVRSS